VLRHQDRVRTFAPEIARALESEWTLAPTVEEAFDAGGITDMQLRMMFSCVDLRLPEETRLALVLHLLCGFSIDETAAAFLKNKAAMEKRLTRAKKALASSRDLFELKGASDVGARLPAVLRVTYLIFNEGYHGASCDAPVRSELCAEAMHLIDLLLGNPLTTIPATHALAALMNFLAARLSGRMDAEGHLLLLGDQDRSRWDADLIAAGRRHLERSASGDEVTPYHIEAAIAERHAAAKTLDDTDWDGIVSLYTAFLRISPSPVVALNRAVAIAHRDGPSTGLAEIEAIADSRRLLRYPFFFTAIGELQLRLGRTAKAREAFDVALGLARNPAERQFLEGRVRHCDAVSPAP
jgi:RNA polymerase sigma-70 factor (ECF subfamily)